MTGQPRAVGISAFGDPLSPDETTGPFEKTFRALHRYYRRAAHSEDRSVTWLRRLNAPTAGLCMKLDTRKLPFTIRVRRTAKSVGNIWLRRRAQSSHTTNSSRCRMARMFDRASMRGLHLFVGPTKTQTACVSPTQIGRTK